MNDNSVKLDHFDKSIRATVEKRRKLIEKNKSITYDALSKIYGKERQELVDVVTEEHALIRKLIDSGNLISALTAYR